MAFAHGTQFGGALCMAVAFFAILRAATAKTRSSRREDAAYQDFC
jgi:hypothetical protein